MTTARCRARANASLKRDGSGRATRSTTRLASGSMRLHSIENRQALTRARRRPLRRRASGSISRRRHCSARRTGRRSALPLPTSRRPVASLDLVGCRCRPPPKSSGVTWDPRHCCPPSVPAPGTTQSLHDSQSHDTLSERGAVRYERCRRLATRSRCRPTTGRVMSGVAPCGTS